MRNEPFHEEEEEEDDAFIDFELATMWMLIDAEANTNMIPVCTYNVYMCMNVMCCLRAPLSTIQLRIKIERKLP